MIFNFTVEWFLNLTLASQIRLNGSEDRSGYLEYNGHAVQISPNSVLLEIKTLQQICSFIYPGSFYPLFTLSTRVPSTPNTYRLNCDRGCRDVYLECKSFPFRMLINGDIQVNYKSSWSAYCTDVKITIAEAKTFCGDSRSNVSVNLSQSGNQTNSWRITEECSDAASTKTDCAKVRRIKEVYCDRIKLVAVNCGIFAPVLDLSRFNYRLQGVGSYEIGVVQVFVDGGWGGVCMKDPQQSPNNIAKVVCRAMGLHAVNVVLLPKYTIPYTSATIWMDDVICDGSESSLLECNHVIVGASVVSCHVNDSIAVSCGRSSEPAYSVRLIGGPVAHSGRVHVFLHGVWGSICKTQLSPQTVDVICNQLGLLGPNEIIDAHLTDVGPPAVIWLTQVRCTDKDVNLTTCSKSETAFLRCVHEQDLVVRCGSSENPNSNVGRVLGGTIGAFAFLIVVTVFTCCFHRRKNPRSEQPVTRPPAETEMADQTRSSRRNQTFTPPEPPSSKYTKPPPSYYELFPGRVPIPQVHEHVPHEMTGVPIPQVHEHVPHEVIHNVLY